MDIAEDGYGQQRCGQWCSTNNERHIIDVAYADGSILSNKVERSAGDAEKCHPGLVAQIVGKETARRENPYTKVRDNKPHGENLLGAHAVENKNLTVDEGAAPCQGHDDSYEVVEYFLVVLVHKKISFS